MGTKLQHNLGIFEMHKVFSLFQLEKRRKFPIRINSLPFSYYSKIIHHELFTDYKTQ